LDLLSSLRIFGSNLAGPTGSKRIATSDHDLEKALENAEDKTPEG